MTSPPLPRKDGSGKKPVSASIDTRDPEQIALRESEMKLKAAQPKKDDEPAKMRIKISGVRTGNYALTAYTGPASTVAVHPAGEVSAPAEKEKDEVSASSGSKDLERFSAGITANASCKHLGGSSNEINLPTVGVSSDQLLKAVDGSHQPSLNNTTISGLSQLDMLSLKNLEESIDKELKEAQERKHLCETEERNALKVYTEVQRSLIEANARCAELYSKRESLSAHYGSLIQEGTRLLWPSVHPAGEVSAPAEKEKDEVSASGSKNLERFSAGIAGSLTTPGSLKQTHPGWIIEKKQAVSIAASHEQQIALRESELKLKAAQPKKDDAISTKISPARRSRMVSDDGNQLESNEPAKKRSKITKKSTSLLPGPVSSASKELVLFEGNVPINAKPLRVIKKKKNQRFSVEESNRFLESVEALLADDKFLHSKRRNWKQIHDLCFKEEEDGKHQRTNVDLKDRWDNLVKSATSGKQQRGEKLPDEFFQRVLVADALWKSGQQEQQQQEEDEEQQEEDEEQQEEDEEQQEEDEEPVESSVVEYALPHL